LLAAETAPPARQAIGCPSQQQARPPERLLARRAHGDRPSPVQPPGRLRRTPPPGRTPPPWWLKLLPYEFPLPAVRVGGAHHEAPEPGTIHPQVIPMEVLKDAPVTFLGVLLAVTTVVLVGVATSCRLGPLTWNLRTRFSSALT